MALFELPGFDSVSSRAGSVLGKLGSTENRIANAIAKSTLYNEAIKRGAQIAGEAATDVAKLKGEGQLWQSLIGGVGKIGTSAVDAGWNPLGNTFLGNIGTGSSGSSGSSYGSQTIDFGSSPSVYSPPPSGYQPYDWRGGSTIDWRSW